MKVKDIMVKDVVTIRPDDSFYDIVALLSENKISGAPVAEGDKAIGMISESDIMRFISRKTLIELIENHKNEIKEKSSLKAKSFMTKKLVCVKPGDKLNDVISLMNKKDINRVPVVDKKKLVGIITRADVVSVVSEYLSHHPLLKKRKLEIEEPRLETNIDKLLSMLKEKGPLKLGKAAKEFKISSKKLEEWARILEDNNLIRLRYPPFGEPTIIPLEDKNEKKPGKK